MRYLYMGPLVPTVKSEASPSRTPSPAATSSAAAEQMDRETLCPICMQTITHAFITACGHSFCYMCIVTHLRNKSDCPCCSHYLTNNHIFPNLLLDKLLKKSPACQVAKTASPVENLRQALQQGSEVPVEELDDLLSLLTEKKRRMEQEEAEKNMRILHDFLHCLRKQKLKELSEIQADLQYIMEDINAVEKQRFELYRAKDRCLAKVGILDDPTLIDRHNSNSNCGACGLQEGTSSGNLQNKKVDEKAQISTQVLRGKEACGRADSEYFTQSGQIVTRKGRIYAQFNDLQECYLQKRRCSKRRSYKKEEMNADYASREGYNPGLEDFQSALNNFTQYSYLPFLFGFLMSQLRVIAELRHGDLFHFANIVSSIEFDHDDEFLATTGVSRRTKVINEPADVHCPVVEMSTRSKLSCLS